MKSLVLVAALLFTNIAAAHEMTPTYFRALPSLYEKIVIVKMDIFNRRTDVSQYQFEAYDAEWNALEFASFKREVNLETGTGTNVELYFRIGVLNDLVYICSRSATDSGNSVSSLICS